ncbi:hypothetical protein KUA55_17105 [Enterococcus sp. ALS3]|uniref:Uncharacterized protein n=1 Tax=Enterococcus alishanensis TaxID=1303817 RepID=A0ABS6THM2_9ENTE|nr:DUF6287 domain-containing protein [Enterococcus alishanensis]MBV7392381.1 hypothetical protein [Enterococcus alishanensis]
MKNIVRVLMFLTGLFSLLILSSHAEAATNEMYRLYNPSSGEHFYTANENERDNIQKAGWKYEGVGWYAPISGESVYRLYNGNAGDHHYTKDSKEKTYLENNGWKYEGVGWYSDIKKSIPLYRAYNPNANAGSHNYTVDSGEQKNLINYGWKDEGISWYGVDPSDIDKKIAFTGFVYDKNNNILKNTDIKIKNSDNQVTTVTTDDEGYFFTHLILGDTYTLNGENFEVTVTPKDLNKFETKNKYGKIVNGKNISNSNGSMQIQPSTIAIDTNRTNYDISSDYSSITFFENIEINAGDILYLEAQDGFEGGLGLQVTSVEKINGRTIAKVQQAELGSVVTSIQGEVTDSPVTQANFVPATGVAVNDTNQRRATASTGVSAAIQFDSNGINVDGSLNINGKMSAEVNIDPFNINNAVIKAQPELSMSFEGDISLTGKKETIKKNIGTIYIPTGIPGITANVPIDLVISVEGKVSVQMGVTSTITMDVGYDKGNIKQDYSKNTDMNVDVKGEVTVKSGLEGSVSLAVLTQIEGLKLSVGTGAKCTSSATVNASQIQVKSNIGAYADLKYSFPILKNLGSNFNGEFTLYKGEWDLKVLESTYDLPPSDNTTEIDRAAILSKNYSSLNGTWENSHGYQLIFNNGYVTMSGSGLGGVTQFSLVNPVDQQNLVYLSFNPRPLPNGMSIMIATKGSSPSGVKDGTDNTSDRIIMGNNGGALLFAPKEDGGIPDTAYYKIEPDNITLAYEQLIGKRFILGPLLYDGQDVNQAMNENNAPQNLVHDGTKLITFVDDSTVHIELAGTYRPDYDTSYTLTNNTITIDNETIPYSVENGVISFSNWTTDVNGHTITWSFTQ